MTPYPGLLFTSTLTTVLADALLRNPEALIQEAEYAWSEGPCTWGVHMPRRRGWVVITCEEFTELGIPARSLRGNGDTSFTGLLLVDRRCLKRYRRRAGRR